MEGLDEEQGRRPHVPSDTTLLGPVRHLAEVEPWWFRKVFLGEELPDLYATREDPAGDFHPGPDAKLDDAIATYQEECRSERRITADARRPGDAGNRRERRSLRRILVHMIEETARHNGHADVLRELTDGAVGE